MLRDRELADSEVEPQSELLTHEPVLWNGNADVPIESRDVAPSELGAAAVARRIERLVERRDAASADVSLTDRISYPSMRGWAYRECATIGSHLTFRFLTSKRSGNSGPGRFRFRDHAVARFCSHSRITSGGQPITFGPICFGRGR